MLLLGEQLGKCAENSSPSSILNTIFEQQLMEAEGGRRSWGSGEEEKEAMFEKALTPSDVGKLNRLVIPKQQAEKYFPMEGDNKGVLLSFEDESGKCWRFRYSYWNSSQSYVLTKGWSRYVKEKRLDAGDVVSFLRHPTDSHRLFITWRRRHSHAAPAQVSTAMHMAVRNDANSSGAGVGLGVPWITTPFYSAHPYPTDQYPLAYQPQTLHAPGLISSHTTSPSFPTISSLSFIFFSF